MIHTAASLKQQYTKFKTAKAALGIKARSWEDLARKTNETSKEKALLAQIESLKAENEQLKNQLKKLQNNQNKTASEVLESLKNSTDNYIPLYLYRAALSNLSREQQDKELYKLWRENVIELSSLQEAAAYSKAQIAAAIDQGDVLPPLFFASFN